MNLGDTKHIKDKVKYIRTEVLHESQESFAERVNISKDTVSNIERGKVIPSLSNLVCIANYVRRPVDYFLSDNKDS